MFEVLEVNTKTPTWVHDIIKFLMTEELPPSKEEARKVKNKVARFTKINGIVHYISRVF